jgi:hypothetical protein
MLPLGGHVRSKQTEASTGRHEELLGLRWCATKMTFLEKAK